MKQETFFRAIVTELTKEAKRQKTHHGKTRFVPRDPWKAINRKINRKVWTIKPY